MFACSFGPVRMWAAVTRALGVITDLVIQSFSQLDPIHYPAVPSIELGT